jgi:hypothetical protein
MKTSLGPHYSSKNSCLVSHMDTLTLSSGGAHPCHQTPPPPHTFFNPRSPKLRIKKHMCAWVANCAQEVVFVQWLLEWWGFQEFGNLSAMGEVWRSLYSVWGLSVTLVWYGHDFLPKAKPGSNQIRLHLSIVITIPPAGESQGSDWLSGRKLQVTTHHNLWPSFH